MIINDCMKHNPFQTEYKEGNGILDKSLTFISDREKNLQINMDLYCLRQDHLFSLLYSTTKYQSN